MLPIFILVIMTWIMSFFVYHNMMENEKESCWERLEIATKSTAQKIEVRLTDNISFLEAVADSITLTEHLDDEKAVGNYLTSIYNRTIFESIDVLLPDDEMIKQNGERIYMKGELSFEELSNKGSHISPRCISPFTNKEVLYCFTPIYTPETGEVEAIICGTMDCKTLSKTFEVFTYKDDAQLFLIDCDDGNYIIDNWHQTLGNINDLGHRKDAYTGEMIDLAPSILNREAKRTSFISNTNGENSYQYQHPVNTFNWELCVVVQEDIVFEHANKLNDVLITVGIMEFIIVLVFTLWNMHMNVSALRRDAKLQELELTKITNEAKSRFISNMSHDIKTPLNGIVGMLHIVRTHSDDRKLVEECLDKIEIFAHYLTTLTNDMLDINEIESDKFVLESIPINLEKLADNICVIMEPKASNAMVSYNMDYSGVKNPFVLGSPVHIERVLVNLIGNAIKYKRATDAVINITISEQKIDSMQSVYIFEIKDNGIGMSEEFQKNMYNAFAQENAGARSSYQGYGLGLAIVYRLIEKMNGDIKLQSVKGEGSTFTVSIPLRHDTENRNTDDVEEKYIEDLSGINILLVEDNEYNKEIAEVILTDVGACVVTAENGKIALETFEKSTVGDFNLILMDIMMPEMDGIEATKAIRTLDRKDAKAIPIFAMTANTFTEEINRCIDAGMNEHIAKPLDIEKLIAKVAKYCGKL